MLRKFGSSAFSIYRAKKSGSSLYIVPGFFLSRINMSNSACRIINYEQLKKYIQENSIYLIDVRETKELKETGVLPGSINIPLAEVETALQLSGDQFQTTYGRDKPGTDSKIVFSCKSGRRSDMALQTALKLGYKNALSYGGGWMDWEVQSKG